MTPDEALGLAIDELAARVTAVEADLADLQLAGRQPSQAAADSPPVSEPLYRTLDEWVGEYFLPTFIRPLGGEYRWCVQWHDHAEAVGRLESLWRAWEVLRLDPGLGMAAWFTQDLDAQLPVLLGRSGPFAQCSLTQHMSTHVLRDPWRPTR
jgi:hypothetical protein